MWLSTLSISESAKTYHEQKVEEALHIIKAEENKKRVKKETARLE